MATYEFYKIEQNGPVAWVYLNRPEKNNAMHLPAWTEALPIFESLDADPEIRAVVIAGNGDCFCAGLDLMDMASAVPELAEPNPQGGTKWRLVRKISELQETMNVIERCRKPVIAAIHGHCIGAGLDMAAACDIRLCASDAIFSLREAAVGIVADVGSLQRLPRIVGQGIARELAFTAAFIDARRAAKILLVNEVFKSVEDLMVAAQAMAETVSENSPLAVQAAKDVLNYSAGRPVEDGLRYVAGISANIIPSADLMESVTAFAEKRKPKFTGE